MVILTHWGKDIIDNIILFKRVSSWGHAFVPPEGGGVEIVL